MNKTLLLLLLLMPGMLLGQQVKTASAKNQFVLFDVEFTYTKADADNSTPSKSHYYVKHDMLNPLTPKDWTSPVDYRNGTVHIRIEVLEKPPGGAPTTWTLCYIPNKGQNNGYGCTSTGVYTEEGVYEQDVLMNSWWENESIVWTEGIKQMDLVIKDDSGGQGHAHKRTDFEKFFPTKVRITMIQVAAGAKYNPDLLPKKPGTTSLHSQVDYKKQGHCNDEDIPRYTANKISIAPTIDGKLDEAIWKDAPRSNPFTDLISGAPAYLNTQASVLWDDQHLYVAYWIDEPDVTATFTRRDAPIFKDNDVELFIAGPDGYYEFEINSFGTIYEVLFFWMDAFEKKKYHLRPEFNPDAKGVKPFNGVAYKHPRGRRIGFWNWDMPGLQSAVHIDGTINNNKDKDNGWTVEIAIPWTSLKILAEGDGRALPPKTGDTWRMDFSRFNVRKGRIHDSGGWAWSSHGVWDSHVPECFTYIKFSE